jgi:hypothetical protein
VKRFAPGTPIRERFRGWTVECVWERLQRATEGRLPELRTTQLTWAIKLAGWVGTSLIVLVAGATAMIGIAGAVLADDARLAFLTIGLAGPITLLLLLGLPLYGMLGLLARFDDRLPVGIRTFRDLAKAIAASTSTDPSSGNAKLPS